MSSLRAISRLVRTDAGFDRPWVHVAGSKGKGSTVFLAAHLLRLGGLKVGVFSSPHLLELRECVQINEVPVSTERLDAELARWRAIDAELSDFEALTVAAFSIFQQEHVDVALVECGWGGARDATNIEGPKNAAVLTHVEEEHLGVLGDTVAEIAREKLGIARPNVPLLTVAQSASVEEVLKDFDAEIVAPGVAGVHPPESVGLALRIALLFGVMGRVEDLDHFQIPGRFELISWQGRTLILDGAHTMDSIRRLRENVQARDFSKVTWALHFLKDKHADLPSLFEGEDVAWISLDDERAGVAPDGWRVLELNQFFDQLPEGVVVFAGSFKLVAEVKRSLNQNAFKLRVSTLWREPRIMLNILAHPFEQDPLGCFFNAPVYVAQNEAGHDVSYCVLEIHDHYHHLKDVFTFRGFRGHGFARRLIRSVVSNVVDPIFLLCPDYRVSFYRELGFEMADHPPRRLRLLQKIGSLFLWPWGVRVCVMSIQK